MTSDNAIKAVKIKDMPPFVIAAVVSAELSVVVKTASAMSLTAMNAKVITMRAGDEALGFQALTGFVSELAQTTGKSVEEVSKKAQGIATAAVTKLRLERLNNDVLAAQKELTEDHSDDVFHKFVKALGRKTRDNAREFERDCRDFYNLLDNLEQQIRSVKYVVSNCRIEAAMTGVHRAGLETVADSLEKAAREIESYVMECQRILGVSQLRKDA